MARSEATKGDRLNVRISSEQRRQLEAVAAARGVSLSGLVLDLVEREHRVLALAPGLRIRAT